MLEQIQIFHDGLKTKLQASIDRLRAFEPEEGYYVAFSGGKDSQCIYELCKMAGVKFDAHYRVTGIDPPELVRFIKRQYPDVEFEIPKDNDGKRITMWKLIEQKKMPPTRTVRYCCEHLKESGGTGRVTVTGVRWAESSNRKKNQGMVSITGKPAATKKKADHLSAEYAVNKSGGIILNTDNDASRRMVEQCYRTQKIMVNPIIDWSDEDVWHFLNDIACVPHCELYDEGFHRLGCVGCPMANASHELERWPRFKDLYLNAFGKMINARKSAGLETSWDSPEEVMDWWLRR